MKTIAYLRVSTDKQDLKNQKLAVHDYCHKNKIKITKFIGVNMSSRKSTKERRIDEILNQLKPKDRLIVSELSRLGRSVGQIIRIVDHLIKNKISLVCIKENIILNGKQTLTNKIMITLFSLFAEIERDLISQRTREGLALARKKGKQLGRPRGSFNSKLDGKEAEIKILLKKKVSKASIARIFNISKTGLYHFVNSRKLV